MGGQEVLFNLFSGCADLLEFLSFGLKDLFFKKQIIAFQFIDHILEIFDFSFGVDDFFEQFLKLLL